MISPKDHNKPLVSILMTAYNEEKHLRESIESILNQTYQNFEFIIINDGSTDGTDLIINSYGDSRIKYIRNETNIKLIDSLNKGLSMAIGKYIARMDADDISVEDRIEKQVIFMEHHPHVGISGTQLKVFGNFEGQMTFPLKDEDIRLHLFITSCFGNNAVIFRKSIMDQHRLFFPKGYHHAEDYKSWTNWIRYTKVENLDEYLVNYRSHSNSVSNQYRSIQRATRNRVRKEYLADVFSLNTNDNKAADATGKISGRRMQAIKHIFKLNAEKKTFNPEKLKETFMKVWYLDSLEESENSLFILLKYPLIFSISFHNGLRNWLNLSKHAIKTRLSKKGD